MIFFRFSILLACLHSMVFAQMNEAFDQANILYEQGEYAEAAAAYRSLLETESSANLHFNLGNALHQLGKIGEALKSYHEALLLSPKDSHIHHNIQFTREKIPSPSTLPRSFLQSFLFRLTLNQWTWMTSIAFWIWMLSHIAALIWGSSNAFRSNAFRRLKHLSGACFLCLAIVLFIAAHERWGKDYALIAVPEAVVRFGPFEESKSSHALIDGVEVLLLDHKDGWHQIQDPRGQIGWIQETQALRLPIPP